MSGLWLKMVGSTDSPCPESYERDHVDFVRKPISFRSGDDMVFYAAGGTQRVFAIARAIGEPYDSRDRRWPYRMNVKYILNLPLSSGVHIDELSTPRRNLRRSVRRASYIRLDPEEYERAAKKLQQAANRLQQSSGKK